ncbi:DnaJ domain-containing protein [Truncatella angustata]|uniref:DnaJ domain-containing protein n=1 Tax=Truncatella angustata TaxID=152316 RepID=A0A9P8UVV6_9PEZI|nr:DnaJ domain-containing protein [Truncatella angustata]KAH6660219.1 DnaJ domain-containing protein [Truncatella angustata]KAH8199915.1 hypothetical protein TruAng_005911 [Truncatella angustata]
MPVCFAVDPDHYDDLGVRKDASAPEIRKAYCGLARKCHPNNFASIVSDDQTRAANEDRFKDLEHAYGVLRDETKRAVHDESLTDSYVVGYLTFNGFEVTTTTTIQEVVAFLARNGFPAFMREIGLPIEGKKLFFGGQIFEIQTEVLGQPESVFEKATSARPVPETQSTLQKPGNEAEAAPMAAPSPTLDPGEAPHQQSGFTPTKHSHVSLRSALLCLFLMLSILFECHKAFPRLTRVFPKPSHYEVLNISTYASDDEIKQAYRRAVKMNHPDKAHGREAAAKALENMIMITDAYGTLSSELKCAYDRNIAQSANISEYHRCLLKFQASSSERQREAGVRAKGAREQGDAAGKQTRKARDAGLRRSKEGSRQSNWHRARHYLKTLVDVASEESEIEVVIPLYVRTIISKSAVTAVRVRTGVVELLDRLGEEYHWICYKDEIIRLLAFTVGRYLGFDLCV